MASMWTELSPESVVLSGEVGQSAVRELTKIVVLSGEVGPRVDRSLIRSSDLVW